MSPERASGLLNIYKPVGPTSHDVVARIRRLTRVRQVGHAGTLDPLAEGVLIICLGQATRLSEYAMRSPKQYLARVWLGISTDTYDREGRIVEERPLGDLTADRISAALEQFQGEIYQVPPMYSAIQQEGQRLYDLARQGREVPRQPRRVTISAIRLVAWTPPEATVEVTCSPGTYIRSLAHDLGATLGVGGHLSGLVRMASGSFHLADAIPLAAFEEAAAAGNWRQYLLPPERALAGLPIVQVTAEEARRIQHGGAIPAPPEAAGEAGARGPAGELLAVLVAKEGRWQPVKVFPPEG